MPNWRIAIFRRCGRGIWWEGEAPAEPIAVPVEHNWLGRSLALPKIADAFCVIRLHSAGMLKLSWISITSGIFAFLLAAMMINHGLVNSWMPVGPGLTLDESLVEVIVRKTERVSAAFIKELLRRITQYSLERDDTGTVAATDVDHALDEMLFRGGLLNLKLLGAGGTTA